MRDFKNYKVWERAHHLTLEIYHVTKLYPKDENYGLISQMRRSASSIPTNIAEGCGRNSDTEFARFVSLAAGSACELEYQLILSFELKYIEEEKFKIFNTEINEIKKMLSALYKTLKANS